MPSGLIPVADGHHGPRVRGANSPVLRKHPDAAAAVQKERRVGNRTALHNRETYNAQRSIRSFRGSDSRPPTIHAVQVAFHESESDTRGSAAHGRPIEVLQVIYHAESSTHVPRKELTLSGSTFLRCRSTTPGGLLLPCSSSARYATAR